MTFYHFCSITKWVLLSRTFLLQSIHQKLFSLFFLLFLSFLRVVYSFCSSYILHIIAIKAYLGYGKKILGIYHLPSKWKMNIIDDGKTFSKWRKCWRHLMRFRSISTKIYLYWRHGKGFFSPLVLMIKTHKNFHAKFIYDWIIETSWHPQNSISQ